METLCRHCQAFDIQAFAIDTAFPWRGYPARQVKESAADGCDFCKALVAAFSPQFQGLPDAELWRDVVKRETWLHFRLLEPRDRVPGPGLGAERLAVEMDGTARPPLVFHLTADKEDVAATSGDIVGNYTERLTVLSDSYTSSIQAWLASCARHDKCPRTLTGTQVIDAAKSPLPSRCIHISKPNPNEPVSIKLCKCDGERGPYLTLTHRWTAETQSTSTTKVNEAERHQGKGFESLPRLFTDFFELAHRLEISYVWIDSLCIIQGEGGEWETESLRMAEYYQQSVLTVACPVAGVDIGLFSQEVAQNDSGIPLIRLPYRDKTGEHQGYFYLFRREEGLRQRFDNVITKGELLSRGWVFQEWMLSRRIVCFTSSGLFFLCSDNPPQTQLGEAVYAGPVDVHGHVPVHFSLKSVVDFNKHNLDIRHPEGRAWTQLEYDSVQRVYRNWETIVHSYSGLLLTNPSQDRLVALSGVAEEFGRALEERSNGPEHDKLDKIWGRERPERRTYVSGLWLSSIAGRGLLWEQVNRGVYERIPGPPTWSWASLNTQVRWTDDRRFSFHQYSWQVDSKRPAGDIVGSVKVLNPLLSALASVDDEGPSDDVSGSLQVLPIDRTTTTDQRARFPILCFVAKLQPVILGKYFASKDDRRIASNLTSRSHELGLENWRTVASPLDPDKCISGWASIEHPEMQVLDTSDLEHVFALHISTINDVPGGIALGYVFNKHPVFNVLFVRRVRNVRDGFERLGVGRLFGREMEKGKEMAVAREVRLV